MCNIIIIMIFNTYIYDFLNIPNGARYSVLGSNISIKGDAYALFSNPASIKVNKRAVSLNYIEYLVGIRGGAIVYLQEVVKNNIGIGLNYLNYGEMEEMDAEGKKIGSFSPQSLLSVIGYSTSIGKASFGLNLKLIYETISEYTSIGCVADIGCNTKWQDLIFTFTINNIGAQIKKFTEEKESIPSSAKISVNSFLFDTSMQVCASIELPDKKFSLGSEWRATKIFAVLFGYNSFEKKELATGGPLDIFAGLCCGFGFFTKSLQIDYAIIPKCELGIVHQISLTPIL